MATYLGTLCNRGHDYDGSGKSLRHANGACARCTYICRAAKDADPLFRADRLAKIRARKRTRTEQYRAKEARYRERVGPEFLRLVSRKGYYKNREKEKQRCLDFYHSRPDYRDRQKIAKRELRRSNPELVRQRARTYYRKNSIKIRLRSRLYKAFRQFTDTGVVRIASLYGIDFAAIIKQLGLPPDNRSDWHIDHIRPLASFDFNNSEEVRAAFAPANHQWLRAADNLRKRCSYARAA